VDDSDAAMSPDPVIVTDATVIGVSHGKWFFKRTL
jgi:hypothetical protein